jgi:predicted acyl esterase
MQSQVPENLCDRGAATSNLFKKGHRIWLDISSSNFPHFDVNPNTFEPEGKAVRRQCAVNTVHMDHLRSPHIVLPVVPASKK